MAGTATKNGSGDAGGLKLHCRGDVRLYCGDEDCTPKARKGRALLAILAAEQRPLSRTKIIDLLWSDRQEEQARASLRTLLADLREQFNSRFEDLLVVDRERVGLGPGVRTDLTDPSLARPAGELFEGLDHIDPELDDWLRVEREKWASRIDFSPAVPVPEEPRHPASARAFWTLLALAIAVVIAGLLYQRPWQTREAPLVAVLKFDDVSGRNALLTNGLAEQMRLELAQHPTIRVIGKQSSESEQVAKLDTKAIARLLGATHVVEGSVVPHEGRLVLAVRLFEGKTGKPIFSVQTEASGNELVAGAEPIVPKIATVVSDVAAKTAPSEAMAADAQAYAAVFQARAWMRTYDPAEALKARQLMFQVVSRYPNFVPGLITLAESTIAISDAPGMRGPMPIAQARREAIEFAQRAIKIAPDYGPAYSAMGSVYFMMDEGIPYDRKAAQLSGGSGSARLNWALILARKGNWDEAVKEHRVAAELDPLGMTAQFYLAYSLSETGRRDEAREALNRYFARAVPIPVRLQVISASEGGMFGDLSRGLVAARTSLRGSPSDSWSLILAMTATRRLFGAESAKAYADATASISEMVVHDNLESLEKRIDDMGPEFWNSDFEIEVAGHYLLRRKRGASLVAAYDRAVQAGMPPSAENFAQDELVIALAQAGRLSDANRVLRLIARLLAREKRASLDPLSFDLALVHALAGQKEKALSKLRTAVATGAWLSADIVDHPFNHMAFNSLRKDPEFRSVVEDHDRIIARERNEAVKELTAAGLTPPPLSSRPVRALL